MSGNGSNKDEERAEKGVTCQPVQMLASFWKPGRIQKVYIFTSTDLREAPDINSEIFEGSKKWETLKASQRWKGLKNNV